MKKTLAGLMLCTVLVGCSGTAPFGEDATDEETTTGDEGTGIEGSAVPPGTTSPSPDSGIFRRETRVAEEGDNLGNGFVAGVTYDASNDTFTVDGLAFDGGNVYQRGAPVSSLNGGMFAVYEADQQFPDALNADPINQFNHRAIYGVSRNRNAQGDPLTEFAIVRTGAYVGYGFGGFIYQRDGAVGLPGSGQAIFNGSSAGLRDFRGSGGLEYSTANVTLAIDFEDFNEVTGTRGDAIRGVFDNRRVFDINGNDITSTVVARINTESEASISQIPDARFRVGPGVLDNNGEAVGEVFSTFVDDEGTVQEYETGNYYAILSGDDPNEIVGVVVLENDSEFENVTVRDTAGFIVYRNPAPATP